MIYLKSLLIGTVGAVAAAVSWILVGFVLPIFLPMLVARFRNTGGMSGATIGSGSILLAALIGFIVAAGLALRRFQGVH